MTLMCEEYVAKIFGNCFGGQMQNAPCRAFERE
jgi:hypothetical protein